MSSIGWIKKDDGFIIFKNRDQLAAEERANILLHTSGIVAFSDKNLFGAWAGVNKHGLAILSSYGPVIDKPIKGTKPDAFVVSLDVMKKCKDVDKAADLYVKRYKALNIPHSTNVIVCNAHKAVAIDCIKQVCEIGKVTENLCFKTNHFMIMTKYNSKGTDPGRIKDSELRLARLRSMINEKLTVHDLKRILTYHSKENYIAPVMRYGGGSICRHAVLETVSSAIFNVKKKHTTVHYSLNEAPCLGDWKQQVFKF